MRFANFAAINLIWLIFALGMFYIWAFRKKKRMLEEFAQRELLTEIASGVSVGRQRLKAVVMFIAVVFALFALMRPQWGFRWREIKKSGLDILIAIDTSNSMLAEDVKPNRLERSKLAVKDLVKKLKGDRIGLIAFAGEAFLQCPLTVDYNGFMLSLDDLDTRIISKGGTSISSAIREALRGYEGGRNNFNILVIITDGENHAGDVEKVLEDAKKKGVKIFCIGIGTKEGELIPIIDQAGKKTFLKDREGNFVKSRLDESVLQKIALTTNGSYVRSTGAEFGLDLIYEQKLSQTQKREFDSRLRKMYDERFQIILVLVIFFLILETFITEANHTGKDSMERGFTLLELLITIVIIGVLATLGITQYQNSIEKSRGAEAKTVLGHLRDKCASFYLQDASGQGTRLCDNDNLSIGNNLNQVPGVCRRTHFFKYSTTPPGLLGDPSRILLTATRCTTAQTGKLPGIEPPGCGGADRTITLITDYDDGDDGLTSNWMY